MNVEILSPSPVPKRLNKLSVQHVMPGDVITTEPGFMRGHGTSVEENTLLATVSGIVERVNKLVSVRPLKSRYTGEVGDVVVGRIVQINQSRWKVDVNSKQEGVLQLSSINLPSGAQRRRTHTDELHMREYFEENDLLSAEIQSTYADGSLNLHTRSVKYGKLVSGLFLTVPHALVKRSKNHFHTLPMGVDIILGTNGYIWITESKPPTQMTSDVNMDEAEFVPEPVKLIGPEVRERMARVRNSILVLAHRYNSIHPKSILPIYRKSAALSMPAKDMLKPENIEKLMLNADELDLDELMEDA